MTIIKRKLTKKAKTKRKKTLPRITADMKIGDVMRKRPDAIGKLLNLGLGCVGCHFAMFETIEQGCEVHGLDIKKVIEELNRK